MHPEWQKRYASIQQLQPTLANLPVFIRALHDSNTTIRRFAVAQLGAYDEIDTLPYILQALHDPSPIIRRTAGDVCSDKGDAAALPEMTELLQDSNKLVRWRAARFLYEMGGEEELDALESAADDPEFEIRLQIELAIARITNGGQAEGTVWQQMTRRNH
jgi:HEAT repeat protein